MSGDSALLIVGCSRRKAPRLARGRSWDVYDGRLFQVLKKLLRSYPGWETSLQILIVSARYGIIGPDDEIEPYDDRLTAAVAARRAAEWAPRLRERLSGRRYRAAHANLGRHYRTAIPGLADLIVPPPIDWASGGIGTRNSRTRRWVAAQLRPAADPLSGGAS